MGNNRQRHPAQKRARQPGRRARLSCRFGKRAGCRAGNNRSLKKSALEGRPTIARRFPTPGSDHRTEKSRRARLKSPRPPSAEFSVLEAKPPSALTFFFAPKIIRTYVRTRPNAAKLRPSIPLYRGRGNPDPAHAPRRPPDSHAKPKPHQTHALRMRHRSLRQRPWTLHRPLLHHRDPVRSLRRGNDLPISVGSKVQGAGRLRPGRDAGLLRHPDRRLYLDLEKGRARMGLKAPPDTQL